MSPLRPRRPPPRVRYPARQPWTHLWLLPLWRHARPAARTRLRSRRHDSPPWPAEPRPRPSSAKRRRQTSQRRRTSPKWRHRTNQWHPPRTAPRASPSPARTRPSHPCPLTKHEHPPDHRRRPASSGRQQRSRANTTRHEHTPSPRRRPASNGKRRRSRASPLLPRPAATRASPLLPRPAATRASPSPARVQPGRRRPLPRQSHTPGARQWPASSGREQRSRANTTRREHTPSPRRRPASNGKRRRSRASPLLPRPAATRASPSPARVQSGRRRPLARHGHTRKPRRRRRSGARQRRSRASGVRPRQPPEPPTPSSGHAPSSRRRPLRGHDHTPKPRQGSTSSGKQQSSGTNTLRRRRPQKRASLSSPSVSPTHRCPLPKRARAATQTRPPSHRRNGSHRRVQPQPERTSHAGRERRPFTRIVKTPSTCPPIHASPPSTHEAPMRLRPS